MKILIGYEFSGIVRSAFRAQGHDAWSCDRLPAEDGSPYHIQGEIGTYQGASSHYMGVVDSRDWEAAIFFYPCTHLCVSGARWFAGKQAEQSQALKDVAWLLSLPIPKIALENPIGVISTFIRKPDQIIQPWQFGHGEVKATCLWIRGLPLLEPTQIVDGRKARVHREPPSPDRWKNRSRTYTGIAAAMAQQWGDPDLSRHFIGTPTVSAR